MKLFHVAWTGLLVAALSFSAYASTAPDSVDPYEEFGKNLRAAQEVTPLKSDLFGDQVSLYNGGTEFDVVDIDLPGNSHLPVRLNRRFEIDNRRLDPGRIAGMGDWDLDVPYIEGVFTQQDPWVVVGDLGQRSTARCSKPALPFIYDPAFSESNSGYALQVWDGNQLHIPGGVTEELLQNTESKMPSVADGTNYPWITKSYYRFGCSTVAPHGMTGESFYAISPSGEKYTFNWSVLRVAPRLRRTPDQYDPSFTGYDRYRVFLLATRVEDRFGNWVAYNYDGDHLKTITSNDGREIDINWSGNVVSSATAGVHTWIYNYNASGGLSSVTRPDASKWTYAVVSGALINYKGMHGPPPPPRSCQSDEDSLADTGDFVYSVGSPSGAQGTFTFKYDRHGRTGVPYACADGNPDHAYPNVYAYFDSFSLEKKEVTGTGINKLTWTYGPYADGDSGCGGRCYYTATGPYVGNLETYIPQGTCYTCYDTKVITVTEPGDVVKYTFGISYGKNEGRLLQTETDSLSGQVMRIVTNSYLTEDQIASQSFPPNVGQSLQTNWKNPMVGRTRPVVISTISQDGDTYKHEDEEFDVFARPIKSKLSGSSSKEVQTAYYINLKHWVIDAVMSEKTNGIEDFRTDYDSNTDLPTANYSFGKLKQSLAYNPDGTVASVKDGNNNITYLVNYKLGIPQLIRFPATTDQPSGTTMSAAVDDLGEITSVVDQNGAKTCYGYDLMGRVASIQYPSETSPWTCGGTWRDTSISFASGYPAAYGLPAGHWRQRVTTGNMTTETLFDALWRPVVKQTYDVTNFAGTVTQLVTRYDSSGNASLQSYPQSNSNTSVTNTWADPTKVPAALLGSTNAYDALDRLTSVIQAAEAGVGQVKTTTRYLGGFKTEVTDPNLKVTTTAFMSFDEPTADWPVQVDAPEGAHQTIARDAFGMPISITQYGLYGTESDKVIRSYFYDVNHQLCRVNEPESGDTVTTYDNAGNVLTTASGLTIGGTACGSIPAGAQTAYIYDAMNRVKTITQPLGTQRTDYNYNATGHITWAGSGPAVWENHYNYRGMLTSEELHMVGTFARIMSYRYDANGHVSNVIYPGVSAESAGENVAFLPDAFGRATQAASGSTSPNSNYAVGVQYFPNGQVKQFSYGSGAGYVSEQNDRQLLSSFTYGKGAAVQVSEDEGYDPNGNVLAVVDQTNGLRNKAFQYDGLNRLTSAVASGLWGTEKYNYDPINNLRTRLSGGYTLSYAVDSYNRLSTLSIGSVPFATYQYDARGNRAIVTSGGTTSGYTFDARNQLNQISNIASYQYDASGRRVEKTPNGGNASTSTFPFYNHAGQLLYQYEPASGKSTNYIYLGSRMIARHEHVELAQPGAVTFVPNPSSGSYTVSWGAVPTATSYNLQESLNGGTSWGASLAVSSTSRAYTGKAPGGYVYQVQACKGSTCSGWTLSATLGVVPAPPVSVAVPSGWIYGSYTVSWPASVGADNYTVQVSLNGGSWTTVESNITATSVTEPGTQGGVHTFRVASSNAYGSIGWTLSGPVSVVDTPATITADTNPSAGSYTVSWSAITAGTSYNLQESLNGGAWSVVHSSATTSQAFSGKAAGGYVYRVQGCVGTVCGGWLTSAIVGVVPAPPATITVPTDPLGGQAGGQFTLQWDASLGATGYTVQRNVNGQAWTTLSANQPDTSFFVDITPTGTYVYRVAALNAYGTSGWVTSTQVVVGSVPAVPTGFTVPATGTVGNVVLTWNPVNGADRYMVGVMQDQSIHLGTYTYYPATEANFNLPLLAGKYSFTLSACNAIGCSAKISGGPLKLTDPSGTAASVHTIIKAAKRITEMDTDTGPSSGCSATSCAATVGDQP